MVKCQNIDIFSETLLYVFDFLHEIEANTLQHLDHVMGFKKDTPGISRGLNIQVCVFSIFHRNATINFFDFVHDDTG